MESFIFLRLLGKLMYINYGSLSLIVIFFLYLFFFQIPFYCIIGFICLLPNPYPTKPFPLPSFESYFFTLMALERLLVLCFSRHSLPTMSHGQVCLLFSILHNNQHILTKTSCLHLHLHDTIILYFSFILF